LLTLAPIVRQVGELYPDLQDSPFLLEYGHGTVTVKHDFNLLASSLAISALVVRLTFVLYYVIIACYETRARGLVRHRMLLALLHDASSPA